MPKSAPPTQSIDLADAKDRLAELIAAVSSNETRVLVEQDGATVAALISAKDLKRLARLDERDREAWEILEAMRAPFRGVPPEEIEREAEKALAEVRAERRAERERSRETAATT